MRLIDAEKRPCDDCNEFFCKRPVLCKKFHRWHMTTIIRSPNGPLVSEKFLELYSKLKNSPEKPKPSPGFDTRFDAGFSYGFDEGMMYILEKIMEPNNPLLLDELREMGEVPVWIVGGDDAVIAKNGYGVIKFDWRGDICVLWPGEETRVEPCALDYGKTWFTYRQKPDGCAGGGEAV